MATVASGVSRSVVVAPTVLLACPNPQVQYSDDVALGAALCIRDAVLESVIVASIRKRCPCIGHGPVLFTLGIVARVVVSKSSTDHVRVLAAALSV